MIKRKSYVCTVYSISYIVLPLETPSKSFLMRMSRSFSPFFRKESLMLPSYQKYTVLNIYTFQKNMLLNGNGIEESLYIDLWINEFRYFSINFLKLNDRHMTWTIFQNRINKKHISHYDTESWITKQSFTCHVANMKYKSIAIIFTLSFKLIFCKLY